MKKASIILLCAFLAACGGGSSSGGGQADNNAVEGQVEFSTTLAGSWSGTWKLVDGNAVVSGPASIKVGQSGDEVSGSIRMDGFACFDNDFFKGTVSGNVVTLVVEAPDATVVLDLRRVGEDRLEGKWRGVAGDCAASGAVEFSR